MEIWGPDRVDEVAAIASAALPAEKLSHDELLACLWDDPAGDLEDGVVLAVPGVDAIIAAVVRRSGEVALAYIKLLAVHPGARRLGHGSALLQAAESWAFDRGAREVRLAGSSPAYLWPGVDVRMLAMMCLAESSGYSVTGAELDMSMPATFRADPPSGVGVRRVLDDDDAASVVALVRRVWPWWLAEVELGIELGGCHAAFPAGEAGAGAEPGAALGFVCHSVNRAGVLGPMGTNPDCQAAGIGSALVAAVCRDLMVAHHRDVQVSWVGPVSFYAKCGGAVSRAYRTFKKSKP